MSDLDNTLYTPPTGKIAVWTPSLAKLPNLEAFLGAPVTRKPFPGQGAVAAAGWGRIGGPEFAHRHAIRLQLPYLAVAEGFFRSLDHNPSHAPPCSLVVDKTGIFYDATRPSDLETLLNSTGWETPELLADAGQAIGTIVKFHLSKYNQAPDASPYLLTTPGLRNRIVLMDQIVNDAKVRMGMAETGTFVRMLEKARADHPGAAIFVKTHPAVLNKTRKGYLAGLTKAKHVTLIEQDVSPMSLLAQADEVYTVTSLTGFEALLLGKKVHCFGLPFYAGWGLTNDALEAPRRHRKRTVAELFAAACILYSRYVNPITGEPCSIHEILALLAEQRFQNERNSRYTACLGFSARNRVMAKYFLESTRGERVFFEKPEEAVQKAAVQKGRVAVPAKYLSSEMEAQCARAGVQLIRVQDGFLPPVGNARTKNLFPASSSIVLDAEGLYGNPSRPCALEKDLEYSNIPNVLLKRAAALRTYMIENRLLFGSESTPSADFAPPIPTAIPEGRKVILVPGQPEADFAVNLPGQICRNLDLLQAVRQARPDGFIIFMPPGGKSGKVEEYLFVADLVQNSADFLALLPLADEVHTLSSLRGLDAIIRQRNVHTYGGPFYSGWGLSVDKQIFPRRGRPLTVDMLLAIALIVYPSYYDWHTRMFCGPEEICRLRLMNKRHPLTWMAKIRRKFSDLACMIQGLHSKTKRA